MLSSLVCSGVRAVARNSCRAARRTATGRVPAIPQRAAACLNRSRGAPVAARVLSTNASGQGEDFGESWHHTRRLSHRRPATRSWPQPGSTAGGCLRCGCHGPHACRLLHVCVAVTCVVVTSGMYTGNKRVDYTPTLAINVPDPEKSVPCYQGTHALPMHIAVAAGLPTLAGAGWHVLPYSVAWGVRSRCGMHGRMVWSSACLQS